jgi:hypothetical protein
VGRFISVWCDIFATGIQTATELYGFWAIQIVYEQVVSHVEELFFLLGSIF